MYKFTTLISVDIIPLKVFYYFDCEKMERTFFVCERAIINEINSNGHMLYIIRHGPMHGARMNVDL